MARKTASVFDPPEKPQRSFHDDYPEAVGSDESGRITVDIDGRPLSAPIVVGRRVPGGDDEAASPEQFVAIADELRTTVKHASRSGPELKGDFGRFVKTAPDFRLPPPSARSTWPCRLRTSAGRCGQPAGTTPGNRRGVWASTCRPDTPGISLCAWRSSVSACWPNASSGSQCVASGALVGIVGEGVQGEGDVPTIVPTDMLAFQGASWGVLVGRTSVRRPNSGAFRTSWRPVTG